MTQSHEEWRAHYDLLRADENRMAIEARDHLLVVGAHAQAIVAARKSVEFGQAAAAMLQQLRDSRGGAS